MKICERLCKAVAVRLCKAVAVREERGRLLCVRLWKRESRKAVALCVRLVQRESREAECVAACGAA